MEPLFSKPNLHLFILKDWKPFLQIKLSPKSNVYIKHKEAISLPPPNSVPRALRNTARKPLLSANRLPGQPSPSLCHAHSSQPLRLNINHIYQEVGPGDPKNL